MRINQCAENTHQLLRIDQHELIDIRFTRVLHIFIDTNQSGHVEDVSICMLKLTHRLVHFLNAFYIGSSIEAHFASLN